ncbi:hypothetical protein SDRG_07623 [Saprolegnia diclina VS20]|uniref:Uncharacterized protein n=1 Tax=Saprolegnia diclina (strain VS20) TaxID=1156394 RepID=T0RQG1_SAPDV|nr:hypothetical protein SDRG_07623 [Saprolegnia diclina VS20]EQC34818.1 hypothetical protein SDRG_07623 [Saprolegnia diclina VS20]|eukprot:XP_008611690.1 hypothetical protein SDRG_07623 [Saprolegnia diclina VS20]
MATRVCPSDASGLLPRAWDIPDATAPVRAAFLKDLGGIGYVLAAVGLGCYALAAMSPYLANDFFFAHYAEASTALTNTINLQLLLTRASSLNLLAASSRLSTHDVVGVSYAYPRLLMYQELTTLESAVTGLRNLDTVNVVYMLAQYCWVDWERRWAMASTHARQVRCQHRYASNGAVYLESVLRNIDFQAWNASTQGLFTQRIGHGVAALDDGPAFLTYLTSHQLLDVHDEVRVWSNAGLSYFALQYANQFQIGLQEDIQIQNALGYSWPQRLKTIASLHRGTLWTCDYLFPSLQTNLNVPGGNQSLVQNASTFFGLANANLMENSAVAYPLPPSFQAVHNQIGPMAAIDLLWVPIPPELYATMQVFRSLVLPSLRPNTAFASALDAIGTTELHPTPLQWQDPNLLFYGGNPTCGFGVGLPFVQESFSFDDSCGTQKALTYSLSPIAGLFAWTMLGDVNATASICALLPIAEVHGCAQALRTVEAAASLVPSLSELGFPTSSLPPLQLMQFVGRNTSPVIETQRLLEASFALFGWLSVYEWVMQTREVVSIEGDDGQYVLMSSATPPMPLSSYVISSSFGIYFWYCSVLVSLTLLGLAIFVISLWLYHRPNHAPWFKFQRITSATWLNRTLLIVRGLSAIVCLASASVQSVTTATGQWFEAAPRSLFESCVLAGEATWITYVVHEALHPLTGNLTAKYAPWSSGAAWFMLALLDFAAPVEVATALHRDCFSINMDQMLYCVSGSIHIGYVQRTLVQIAVLLGSIVVTYSVAFAYASYRNVVVADAHSPSLVLSSAATAFLDHNQTLYGRIASLNIVSAAMCGILSIPRCGLFDTKLWLPLPEDSFVMERHQIRLAHVGTSRVLPACSPTNSDAEHFEPSRQRVARLALLGGVAYTIFSLTSNVAFLAVAQTFLANDFGWAGFNSTGMHAFLANAINQQLLISTNMTLDLSSPALTDISQLYNDSMASIAWSAHAPRRQLLDTSVPLTRFAQGLRDMNPCMLPWMFTQYCWLDLDRHWAMASTTKRQARCVASQMDNGAVYLEIPLRNVRDWAAWDHCWGVSFEIGFVLHLQTSQHGQQWLSNLKLNVNSVDDEVALWRRYNITRFQLQWQNYKTIGMVDTFSITSALGYTSSLTLSRSEASFHLLQQTSHRMYWAFASDLWAIATNTSLIGGYSLLASSSNFAFTNTSSQDVLFRNLTLTQPLTPGLTVLQSTIGPFGSVDMHYISCPPAALELYSSFSQALNTLLVTNTTAQTQYFALPAKPRVCSVPPFLNNDLSLMANGGNLMCGNDVPQEPAFYGRLSNFGASSACHALFLDTMVPSRAELFFAFLGLRAGTGTVPDASALCAIDPCSGLSPLCPLGFDQTLLFLADYAVAFSALDAVATKAHHVLYALNIQVIQYYTATLDDADTLLYQINLLDPTEPLWAFYGWCHVFEWLDGRREVVSFQGDAGAVASISSSANLIRGSPDPSEIPVSFATLLLGCTFYMTGLLISIAGLVTLYSVGQKGHVEGNNLYEINRIVGHVWAGRTFLLLRSITAIWMLNTSPLLLQHVGSVTHMRSPPLPWYQTILAAGESTWLVYALNDLGSCVTRQFTTTYAYKSSLLTYAVVSIWTLVAPVSYTAALDRSCTYVDMDAGLVCTSAVIRIGSLRGVLSVVLIACACVTLCYRLERMLHPHLAPPNVHSLFLNSQSLYMLDLSHWQHHGDIFLDKTSAVLAGLLSVEYDDDLYILDIKTWRAIVVPHATLTQPITLQRFARAIPLSRI